MTTHRRGFGDQPLPMPMPSLLFEKKRGLEGEQTPIQSEEIQQSKEDEASMDRSASSETIRSPLVEDGPEGPLLPDINRFDGLLWGFNELLDERKTQMLELRDLEHALRQVGEHYANLEVAVQRKPLEVEHFEAKCNNLEVVFKKQDATAAAASNEQEAPTEDDEEVDTPDSVEPATAPITVATRVSFSDASMSANIKAALTGLKTKCSSIEYTSDGNFVLIYCHICQSNTKRSSDGSGNKFFNDFDSLWQHYQSARNHAKEEGLDKETAWEKCGKHVLSEEDIELILATDNPQMEALIREKFIPTASIEGEAQSKADDGGSGRRKRKHKRNSGILSLTRRNDGNPDDEESIMVANLRSKNKKEARNAGIESPDRSPPYKIKVRRRSSNL